MQSKRDDGSQPFSELFEMGVGALVSGRAHEAVPLLERAVRRRPESAEAHNNLACAYVALGRVAEAQVRLEFAISLRAEYTDALDNLGRLLASAGRHAEAVTVYERAAHSAPERAAVALHLGDSLLALGRHAEAESAFARAIALEPHVADAACKLGKLRLHAGDIDGAVRLFEQAIAREPRNARAHWLLVFSRSGAIDTERIAALERIAADADQLSIDEQVDLDFALAAAYEHVERYDDAFHRLEMGNARKRRAIAYDEATALRYLDSLQQFLTPPLLDALRGCGNPSDRPVFIFGMPRSGTTLVEQLLAAQPTLVAGGELSVLGELVDDLWKLLRAGLTLDELRAQIRTFGDRYLNATDALAGTAERFTDKMPENFRYAPLIAAALPNARMIHVRRDPLDTCVSCYAHPFAGDAVPYAYDLAELGRYYAAYERTLAAWRARLPAGRLLEIDYERLVDDFETEARRIVAFCGLAWSPRTLAFHEIERTVLTASTVQVRRPLYRSALGRSRRFANHLEPLRTALGRR